LKYKIILKQQLLPFYPCFPFKVLNVEKGNCPLKNPFQLLKGILDLYFFELN